MTNGLRDCGYEECIQLKPDIEGHTKSELLQRLKEFRSSIQEDDTVFVFWAGHGTSYKEVSYLLLPKTDLADLSGTAISVRELYEAIASNDNPGKYRIIALDACRSGGQVTRSTNQAFSPKEVNWAGWAMLSACTEGQFAIESQELGNGVFTRAFGTVVENYSPGDSIKLGSFFERLEEKMSEVMRFNFPQSPPQIPVFQGYMESGIVFGVRGSGSIRSTEQMVSKSGASPSEGESDLDEIGQIRARMVDLKKRPVLSSDSDELKTVVENLTNYCELKVEEKDWGESEVDKNVGCEEFGEYFAEQMRTFFSDGKGKHLSPRFAIERKRYELSPIAQSFQRTNLGVIFGLEKRKDHWWKTEVDCNGYPDSCISYRIDGSVHEPVVTVWLSIVPLIESVCVVGGGEVSKVEMHTESGNDAFGRSVFVNAVIAIDHNSRGLEKAKKAIDDLIEKIWDKYLQESRKFLASWQHELELQKLK